MSNASTLEGGKSGTKRGFKLLRLLLIIVIALTLAIVGYNILRPAETPLTRAITLIKAGKAAAALPILEQMARQHPDNPTVFPWLAQCYLQTDRIAEGRTALDTALRVKMPGDMLAPTVLAYANYYESKGDYAEAERLYQSAYPVCAKNDLSEGRARLYLGWSEDDMAQGQLAEAVRHLELANAVADQLAEPLKSLVPHRLAAAYRQLSALADTRDKDEKTARTLLEKSLKVSDEPATRMALAALAMRQGDKDTAIENYRMVANTDPNNLEARHRLIDLLLDKKDYQNAQTALTDLTDKEKSVENYELLASVDLKLQNYAGAVRAYEDATDLRPKVEVLKQLEAVLLQWHDTLVQQKQLDQAASIKGHADRVADQIAEMTQDKDKDNKTDATAVALKPDDPRSPPVALVSSHIWLAKGSLTPEGEIKIHNITGKPVTDLSLSAVFYDNTARRNNGSVGLPVASPQSAPFAPDASRSLYFSCPNIVKADHQLAVIIFWKGRFLKEFPVVKQ
jgi:tetratricopeptide (TPR) repeat protein